MLYTVLHMDWPAALVMVVFIIACTVVYVGRRLAADEARRVANAK